MKYIPVKGTAFVKANVDPHGEVGGIGLSPQMLQKIGEKINIVYANPETQWYVSDDLWSWHVTWLKYIKLELLE